MDNIGGNIITNEYYKIVNSEIIDLTDNDMNTIFHENNYLFCKFPIGFNGLYSDLLTFTNKNFTINHILTIINEFYEQPLSDKHVKILIKNDIEKYINLDEIKCYKDLLSISNLSFFEGFVRRNDIFFLNIGS